MVRRRQYSFDTDEKEPKVKKIIKECIIWFVEIIFVIVLAYLIIAYGVERTVVLGDSMNLTLKDREKVIINKMVYRYSDPERFDVVVFRQSGKEHSYYNIKRIIGLPGETVQIIDGVVFIDGTPLKEKIEVEPMVNGGLADEEILLEENEYFVLGDNRNNSEDSRFANIGAILRTDIIGKAWIRIKPFDFISQINEGIALE